MSMIETNYVIEQWSYKWKKKDTLVTTNEYIAQDL